MSGRIVLVPFSPRVAPGLLSAAAWRAVTAPGARVHAGDPDHPLLAFLDDQDVAIELIEGEHGEVAEELLKEAADGATVVWLADPSGGDQPLVLAIGELLTGAAQSAMGEAPDVELELLPGSYDLPGAKVLDLVAVMDRLRSPGGCPWDRGQTHQSLVKFLLEEAYETVETIEDGDCDAPGEGRDALREELGDVLLQVAFHARIAQEHAEDPFGIDDVAQGIVTKLIGRHPHVFGGARAETAADVEANWDRLKAQEKGRTSAVEGVPLAQPALSLADKLLKRARNANLDVTLPQLSEELGQPADVSGSAVEQQVGRLLLAVVGLARQYGVDPEEALRHEARGLREQILHLEASR
ncbi:MAG TPA: MazG family protein [Actinospica sp.]|jgi:XTP/dITP diphosphohydrolase|nr:MazG family protein [Actinospica sp.]